jgi:two-component system, chemotaxis family, sensor kinase CheA
MADADPYRYFRIEAAELLERLGQGALAIDKGGEVAGGVSALLRFAHTLKGAARVVRQLEIADHAHTIEDVLAPHRASASVPRECGAALRSSLDAIATHLAEIGAAPGLARPLSQPESAPRSKPEEPAVVLRAEVAEVEAVVDGLGESLVELTSLDNPLRSIEKARQLAELLGRQLAAPRRADPEKLAALLERSQRVTEDLRLDLARLDNGLRHGVGRLRRQLEQTHTAAERLRLVPASSIFTPLERAAYDAARELGRQVSFITSGGDVKLDSHVLVVAQGALLHVVRNAVAHGLEPESVRLAAGKPAHGSIWLSVARQGRDVVFTCRDDGAGVDLDKVRQALARRGEGATALSDEQALARLLHGGISTSERLTRLSGRGVGLDVVRAAGEQLGGSVQLRSERGKAFNVELRAPLTVAAVSAVSVECAGKTVSVPLDSIVESVRFKRAEIARAGAHESVCHDGRVLPFASLSKIMGASGSRAAPPMWTSLIVQGARGRAAVGVDRLLGARTVVIRPVPHVAGAHPVVAGATLDALGNPELVLDGEELVASIQRSVAPAQGPSSHSRPILVIDDSLTTRMLEQSILESAGYEVALANSAEEGLEKARQNPYALFLVDVEMPGIDGFTFVDRVRHDPALANVPAVLVSSRSAPEDFERGRQVGAHGYIVKGRFDQRELLGLIERLVSN